MSNRSIELSDALYAYLLENSLRESELQRRLREETAALPGAGMQTAPEQGQFMALLVELTGACRCPALGTFTGYSAQLGRATWRDSVWQSVSVPVVAVQL